MRLLRGGTAIAKMAEMALDNNLSTHNYGSTLSISYLDSPATTSATTYKTQIASEANSAGVIAQQYNEVSTIVLMEIGV